MLSKTERLSHQINQKQSVKSQQLKENLVANPGYFSETTSRGSGDITQRVTMIEQNLNRVCLQQDALMPLLNLLDFVPTFHKNESGIKSIMRRIDESESSLQRHQTLIEQILANHKPDQGLVDQMKELQSKVNFMEETLTSYTQTMEEEISQFNQQLEESKVRILQQIQSIKVQPVSSDQLVKIDEKLENQLLDIQNIYRELEGLKNENEFRDFKKVQKCFAVKLSDCQNLDDAQRMLVLTSCEADRILQEVELFEHSTIQRFQLQIDELNNLRASQLNEKISRKSEVQLRYQVAACKLKYFKDFERLQRIQRSLECQRNDIVQLGIPLSPYVQSVAEGLQHLEIQICQIAKKSKLNLENIVQQIQTVGQ